MRSVQVSKPGKTDLRRGALRIENCVVSRNGERLNKTGDTWSAFHVSYELEIPNNDTIVLTEKKVSDKFKTIVVTTVEFSYYIYVTLLLKNV